MRVQKEREVKVWRTIRYTFEASYQTGFPKAPIKTTLPLMMSINECQAVMNLRSMYKTIYSPEYFERVLFRNSPMLIRNQLRVGGKAVSLDPPSVTK